MAHRKKILFGLLVTLMFLAIGTAGYTLIEHYSVLDAFYMTVITITTVGFGEVHSLSQEGRIFTIFLILFGFGSIAFLAHAFTEAIIERAASRNLGKKTMQKRIGKLKDHAIICGFGRVGEAAAEYFASTGSQFVVIESAEDQLKLLEEYNYIYMEGDATREDVLLAAGIKQASALVALLDSDPDNLFTVLTARELNPTLHIIARTEITSSESRMLRAGADSIVSPYAYAGRKVAQKILEATADDSSQLIDDFEKDTLTQWMEVTEQSDLAGHVVETASGFIGGTIIGIRRDEGDILLPHAEEKIHLGDQLLYSTSITTEPSVKDHSQTRKKIILIDDNAVIRHLYTRLFQKAGFHLITASTGELGYSLAVAERPDAAIVDYELPDISGLKICERLRQNKELRTMKLFLFTANENVTTKDNAHKIGVDTVVIKSPDATEIVNTVKEHLERI